MVISLLIDLGYISYYGIKGMYNVVYYSYYGSKNIYGYLTNYSHNQNKDLKNTNNTDSIDTNNIELI